MQNFIEIIHVVKEAIVDVLLSCTKLVFVSLEIQEICAEQDLMDI